MCCCYSIIYIFSRKIFLIICLLLSSRFSFLFLPLTVFSLQLLSVFFLFLVVLLYNFIYIFLLLYYFYIYFISFFYFFFILFCALPCLPLPKCFFSSSIAVGLCCVYYVCAWAPFISQTIHNPTNNKNTLFFVFYSGSCRKCFCFYSVIFFGRYNI